MKERAQISDPFLCSDCQHLGYCRKYGKENKYLSNIGISKPQSTIEAFSRPPSLTEVMVSNWVPIQASAEYAGSPFRKHVQEAHDLFHEEEFEQASYMYQDMLASRKDCDELIIGLAASLFFLGKYEEAAGVIARLQGLLHSNISDKFSELCAIKIEKAKQSFDLPTTQTSIWKDENSKASMLIG